MTVIAAATMADGHVVLAADRQVSYGWQKSQHDEPKLWTNGSWAMGTAGSLRVGQVLKHHVDWPRYRPDEDPDYEAWLVKTLVPAIRRGVKDHGIVHSEHGVEYWDGSLLMACRGRIVEVTGNGCVLIDSLGRSAIGSGYPEALGALGDKGVWTEADVVDAVRRATVTARGCSGPISVVTTRDLLVRTVGSGS